jgi:hypothetical protein
VTARLIRKRAAPPVRLGLRCYRTTTSGAGHKTSRCNSCRRARRVGLHLRVAKTDDIGKPGTPSSIAPVTDAYACLRAGSDYSSTEWIAYEATDAQDLEGVDIDGIIGCDSLQYFNVYFDYGHHAIYLEPNDAYRRAAHH